MALTQLDDKEIEELEEIKSERRAILISTGVMIIFSLDILIIIMIAMAMFAK